jgi:hypothetical protein
LGKADESTSVYNSLVEIQTLDSIYTFEIEHPNPYQMDFGDQRNSVDNQRRTQLENEYNFGWVKPTPTVKVESTGEATTFPPTTGSQSEGLRVTTYTGPDLDPNNLPYVDKEGFTNNNYAILLTAEWCRWCKLMYRDTIEPLRKEGYKIFIIDIDEFPDIKERIHRLDGDAEKMGQGAPYFVVRQGGKTTKIYYGYTKPNKIRPHLKKPETPYDYKVK